jgi:EAL domain-containing protein (putative c-di-GMP-specific phosphodiesterase class I)
MDVYAGSAITNDTLNGIRSLGRLSVHLQPVYELEGGRIGRVHAFECLTRGPVGTAIEAPVELFAFARKAGADLIVDRACLEAAFEHASLLPGIVRVEANVLATTVVLPSFREYLATLVRRSCVPFSRVVLDVNDYGGVWKALDLPEALERLRAAGVRIAFDEKGLGDPDFDALIQCRPDYLKLDGYLVHGAFADHSKRTMMRATCELARGLGIRLVAEGIETQEDLDLVGALEIDLGQGYALSPPRPIKEWMILAPSAR